MKKKKKIWEWAIKPKTYLHVVPPQKKFSFTKIKPLNIRTNQNRTEPPPPPFPFYCWDTPNSLFSEHVGLFSSLSQELSEYLEMMITTEASVTVQNLINISYKLIGLEAL